VSEQETDETGQVKKRRRITAPSNKTKRHNTIDVITRELKELAKHNPKVYEMIFPQLEEMLENAKMVHNTSSSEKVRMCQEYLKRTGVTVAVVPDSIRRDKIDDVNHKQKVNLPLPKSQRIRSKYMDNDGLGDGGSREFIKEVKERWRMARCLFIVSLHLMNFM
jgi:hypothetical protein